MQNYRKLAFTGVPDDATREDLEDVIVSLVERRTVTPEVINELISMRLTLKDRLLAVEQMNLPEQHKEIVREAEMQYPVMKAAIEHFGISTAGMPALDVVLRILVSHRMAAVTHISNRALIVIPPLSQKELVNAINGHRQKGQKRCDVPWLQPRDWDRPSHLSDGNKPEHSWAVAIADGSREVDEYSQKWREVWSIYMNEWSMIPGIPDIKAMKFTSTWLALMMKSLYEGHPVDMQTFTVLRRFSEAEVLATNWDSNRIKFNIIKDNEYGRQLRVRKIVWLFGEPDEVRPR